MTTSDAIIAWLKTFSLNNNSKIKQMQTDRQSDDVATYALTKEPIDNVKRYVSGKEEHEQYYNFTARLTFQTETSRRDNGNFLEALEEWVNTQNKADNRPNISGCDVSNIKVASSFYVGATAQNSAVYSLTLAIKFSRQGE